MTFIRVFIFVKIYPVVFVVTDNKHNFSEVRTFKGMSISTSFTNSNTASLTELGIN